MTKRNGVAIWEIWVNGRKVFEGDHDLAMLKYMRQVARGNRPQCHLCEWGRKAFGMIPQFMPKGDNNK